MIDPFCYVFFYMTLKLTVILKRGGPTVPCLLCGIDSYSPTRIWVVRRARRWVVRRARIWVVRRARIWVVRRARIWVVRRARIWVVRRARRWVGRKQSVEFFRALPAAVLVADRRRRTFPGFKRHDDAIVQGGVGTISVDAKGHPYDGHDVAFILLLCGRHGFGL